MASSDLAPISTGVCPHCGEPLPAITPPPGEHTTRAPRCNWPALAAFALAMLALALTVGLSSSQWGDVESASGRSVSVENVGMLIGAAALFLGVRGLRHCSKDPEDRCGTAAEIAIAVGLPCLIGAVVMLGLLVLVIYSSVSAG